MSDLDEGQAAGKVALEGAVGDTFVETTNQAAALALAEHYRQQNPGNAYNLVTHQEGKKTFYRIRPRSRSFSSDAAKKLNETEKISPTLPAFSFNESPPAKIPSEPVTASIAPSFSLESPSPERKLRLKRSIPLLRNPAVAANSSANSPTGEPTSTSSSSATTPVTLTCHRPETENDGENAPGQLPAWNEGNSTAGKGKQKESRPLFPRSNSSPFGAGVRLTPLTRSRDLSAAEAQSTLQPSLSASQPFMRPVASSDSIRTAKADNNSKTENSAVTGIPPSNRPRFQDPAVFDQFQSIDSMTSPAPSPALNREHDRLPSTSSIASSLSEISSNSSAQRIVLAATTPGDDSRFVIWGNKPSWGATARSSQDRRPSFSAAAGEGSASSTSQSASPATTNSKRFSLKQRNSGATAASSPASSTRESINSNRNKFNENAVEPPFSPTLSAVPFGASNRILMAATVEKLVAELTSKIQINLLSNFLLTFRLFLTPLNLLHLLIARFTWALQPTSSPEDDAHRKIVRVRTFVVVRHWLLNYFAQDFVPDRELRNLLTNWLNSQANQFKAEGRDTADQNLIKALKKVVRRLKSEFILLGKGEILAAQKELKAETSEIESDGQNGVQTTKFTVQPVFASLPATVPKFENSGSSTLGKIKRILGNRKSSVAETKMGAAATAANENESSDLLSTKHALNEYLDHFHIKHQIEPNSIVDENPAQTGQPESVTIKVPRVVTAEWTEANQSKNVQEKATNFAPTFVKREDFYPDPISAPKAFKEPATSFPLFETEFAQLDENYLFGRGQDSVRIELDDVDLSDDDSHESHEMTKTLKRLPATNNLKFDGNTFQSRDSIESSLSYAAGSPRNGVRFPSFSGPERESLLYVDDEDGFHLGEAPVENFVSEGLNDSDGETEAGDVSAALRRLEGFVDETKELEKTKKVLRQMAKSEELAKRKKSLKPSRELSATEMQAIQQFAVQQKTVNEHSPSPIPVPAREVEIFDQQSSVLPVETTEQIATPVTTETAASNSLTVPTEKSGSLARRTLASKPSLAKLFSHRISAVPAAVSAPRHKSFLLLYRTELLARQFCLIERDLLRTLGWQELMQGEWEEGAVPELTDWEFYLKSKRKEIVLARESGEKKIDSAIETIIARFDLTVNWVKSEILLTAQIDERVALIAKFIRLGFKSFCLSNFQTCFQIIQALNSTEILSLKQTWRKVAAWEMRKFHGLLQVVSEGNNFKMVRELTQHQIIQFGPPGTKQFFTPDEPSGMRSHFQNKALKNSPAVFGCIPFLRVYFDELKENQALPNFIDPTCPEAAEPELDAVTGYIISPHQDDAEPLLPLINVHKMRIRAELVQKILAFQLFAEGFPYEAEFSIYFKCLKIRSLDQDLLKELSRKLEA